jgi:hypothetical protein
MKTKNDIRVPGTNRRAMLSRAVIDSLFILVMVRGSESFCWHLLTFHAASNLIHGQFRSCFVGNELTVGRGIFLELPQCGCRKCVARYKAVDFATIHGEPIERPPAYLRCLGG